MELLKKINFYIVTIYSIVSVFILPMVNMNIKRKVFLCVFLFVNLFYILINYKKILDVKLSRKELVSWTLLMISYLFYIISTQYSIGYTTTILLFLIIVRLSFPNGISELVRNRKLNIIVYTIMCISIIIQLILPKYGTNGKVTLFFVKDKNYTGVIMFLAFIYFNKNKLIFGQILCIILTLFLDSRAYSLMIIIFYISKIFKKNITYIGGKLSLNSSYKVLILSLIFIIVFSNIWLNYVASSGVKNYQEGLNDISNKMRVVSNINVLDRIKNDIENYYLIAYGYDYDIKNVLGISSYNTSSHAIRNGVRLVQPHNSILNIVIKSGIIFSIIYFYILSKLMDKIYTRENIEYILPYLANTIFLHGLLDTEYFLLFILVTSIPIYNKNKTRRVIYYE